MKRLFAIGAMVLCAQIAETSSAQADGNVDQAWVTKNLTSMPLAFTKNMGQWPDSILFRADAGGAVMWFMWDGIYYQFNKRIPRSRTGEEALAAGLGPRQVDPDNRLNREPDSIETAMIKAAFVGASPSVEVMGLEELEYKCNYFIGDDPAKWRTDVPNYSSITFRGLYPGVDAVFGERDGRLECRLTAATPADLAQVRTEYRSAGAVTKETENTVSIQTALGEKRFAGILPLDETERTGASIALTASPNAGVSLLYSTYLGGDNADYSEGIAVDGSGNAYVTGRTETTNFPTQNPYQTDPGDGDHDVFVTKLSAAGNSLLYSTYLGGNYDDWGYGIAVDGSGNAYVTGWTTSTNFPTQNPYQTDQGGEDVFVTKLSAAGNSLLNSTYLGGNSYDVGYGIAVDGSGNTYVTGETTSANFPIQNPYQTYQGYYDVFVTKLSAAGNSLLYSTYLGGGQGDFGLGIAVDGSGNAYVTGITNSINFPTQNPYQTVQRYDDVFVTKLSAAGNSLLYSTYLGGNEKDWGLGIAVDGSGSAYVTGETYSTNFPTQNPYQTDQGGDDVFVTKLSAAGNSLLYSTYLGGSSNDGGHDIAVDASGHAHVTGITNSTNFPTQNPYQTDPGDGIWDAFVTKLSAAGNSLLYSTYLGGSSEDHGCDIAVDGSGSAYVTGNTSSTNFPTQNPYQTDQGNWDAFVTKLSVSADTDSDGVPDDVDNCPMDYNPGQGDLNHNGVGDACDDDIDGDGLLNTDEASIGSDPWLIDTDSDGVDDRMEVFAEGGSIVSPADTDSDAIPNVIDEDDDGDGVPTPAEDLNLDGDPTNDDTDSDGRSDYLDADDDDDGVMTLAEDINLDGDPTNDDTDGDGLSNYRDTDDEDDGVPTLAEDVNVDGDPTNDDTDGDGLPNYLDQDDDDDGIATVDEDIDANGNPLNDDTDADDLPNYLDADDDGDGVATIDEDVDLDGNPLNDDTDADDLANYLDADDDGDGILSRNEDENADGNPANDDTDTDGVPNFLDLDSDDDGVNDGVDNCYLVINPGQEDTDGDNIGDACDACCVGRVGDANGQGDYPDEVTLGDIMVMVDVLFISSDCTKFGCPDEADVNQSGGPNPPQMSCLDYVSLGDIMTLVDFLFITGPETAILPDCL